MTALEHIYRAELGYVLQSLRRLGVANGRLEDLAHEVFLTVHHKWNSFDASRPVRPWLFGIAHRLASNERQRAHVTREEAQSIEVADDAPGPEQHSEQRAARRVIERALKTLDDDKRAIFILHELDQVPVSQAAEVIGVSTETAWSRLRAARKQFKDAANALLVRLKEAHVDDEVDVELERLLAPARGAPPEPSPEVAARVWSRLDAAVATMPVVAAKLPWKVMAPVLAATLAGGLAGGWALHAQLVPPREVIIERRVEVAVPAPVVPSPAPAPSVEPSSPSREAPRVVARPAAQAVASRDGEQALIERARTALQRGLADEALSALDAHRRDYPSGALLEERSALRVQALALKGDVAGAHAAALEFVARFPDSVLLPGVEAAGGL